jgi:hypothetical protein
MTYADGTPRTDCAIDSADMNGNIIQSIEMCSPMGETIASVYGLRGNMIFQMNIHKNNAKIAMNRFIDANRLELFRN